jgi:hypothetical protein
MLRQPRDSGWWLALAAAASPTYNRLKLRVTSGFPRKMFRRARDCGVLKFVAKNSRVHKCDDLFPRLLDASLMPVFVMLHRCRETVSSAIETSSFTVRCALTVIDPALASDYRRRALWVIPSPRRECESGWRRRKQPAGAFLALIARALIRSLRCVRLARAGRASRTQPILAAAIVCADTALWRKRALGGRR